MNNLANIKKNSNRKKQQQRYSIKNPAPSLDDPQSFGERSIIEHFGQIRPNVVQAFPSGSSTKMAEDRAGAVGGHESSAVKATITPSDTGPSAIRSVQASPHHHVATGWNGSGERRGSHAPHVSIRNSSQAAFDLQNVITLNTKNDDQVKQDMKLYLKHKQQPNQGTKYRACLEGKYAEEKQQQCIKNVLLVSFDPRNKEHEALSPLTSSKLIIGYPPLYNSQHQGSYAQQEVDPQPREQHTKLLAKEAVSPLYVSASPFSLHPKPTDYGDDKSSSKLQPDLDFILSHKDNSQERLANLSGDQKVVLENQKLQNIPQYQISHPSNLKTPNSLTGNRISVKKKKTGNNPSLYSSRKNTAARQGDHVPPITVNFRASRAEEKRYTVEELNLRAMTSSKSPTHSSKEDKTSQYSRRLIQLNEQSKSPASTNSNFSPGRGFNNAISSIYEQNQQQTLRNSKAFHPTHGQKQFKILSCQQLQKAMSRVQQNNGAQAFSRNEDSAQRDVTQPSDPAPCYVQIPLSQCNIPIADDEQKPLENKQLKNNLKVLKMQRSSGIGKIDQSSVHGQTFSIPVAIHQNNNPTSYHNRSHFSQNSYDDLDCASPPPVQIAPEIRNSKQRSPLTPSHDDTLPLLGPESKLYYEKALEANNQSQGFNLKQARVPCKVNRVKAPFTSNKPSVASRNSNPRTATAELPFKRGSTGQNYSHMEASNNSHLSINSIKQDSYMKSPKTHEGSSCSPAFKTQQTREQVNMSFSRAAQSLLKNEIENSKVMASNDPDLSKELLLKSFGISVESTLQNAGVFQNDQTGSTTHLMVKQPPQIYKEKFDQAKIPVLPSWKSGLKALKHKPQTSRDMNKRAKDKLKNILEQEELRIDTTNGRQRQRKKVDRKKTSMLHIADLTNKQYNQMQLLQQEFFDLFLVSDLGHQQANASGDIEGLRPTMQLTNMTDMSLLLPEREERVGLRQFSRFEEQPPVPRKPAEFKGDEKSCLETEKFQIDSPHSPTTPASLAPITPSIIHQQIVTESKKIEKPTSQKASVRVIASPVKTHRKRPINLSVDFNDAGVQSIFKTLNSISHLKELKSMIEQQKTENVNHNQDLQQLTSVMQHSLLQNNNQLLAQLQGISTGQPKNAFQEVMQDDRFQKWRSKLTDINDQIQQVTHLQRYAEDPFNRSLLNQDLDVSFSKPGNVQVKIEANTFNTHGRMGNISSHFGPGIHSTVDSHYLKSPQRGTGFSNPDSRKQSTLAPSKDAFEQISLTNQSAIQSNMDALLQKSRDFCPDKDNINHIKNVLSLDLSKMNRNVAQLCKGKLTERYVPNGFEAGESSIPTIEERVNTNVTNESSKLRCEVQAVDGQLKKINLMEQYQSVDSMRDQTRTTFKDSEHHGREDTMHVKSQDPTPDVRGSDSRMSINIQVVKNKSPDSTVFRAMKQKLGTPGGSGLQVISLEDTLFYPGQEKLREQSLAEPSMISEEQLKKNMKIISDQIIAREQNMHYDENYFANKNKEYEKIQKAELNRAGMFKKNYKYAPQTSADIDFKIKQLESEKHVDEFGPFHQGQPSTATIVQHQSLKTTQRRVVESTPNRGPSPTGSQLANQGVVTAQKNSRRRIENSATKLDDSNSQGHNELQDEGENTIHVPKLKSIINKHKNGKPELGPHYRNISMESDLNASDNLTSYDQSYLRGMGSHKRLSSKGSPIKKVSQHGNRMGKKPLQKRQQQPARRTLPPNRTIVSVEDSSSLAQDSVLFGAGEPSKTNDQILMIENVSRIKIRNSLESVDTEPPTDNLPLQTGQMLRKNQAISNDSSVFNSLVSREKLRFRFSKKYVQENIDQSLSLEHSPRDAKGSNKMVTRTNLSFLNQNQAPQLGGQFFSARNSQSSYQTVRQRQKGFLPSLNVGSADHCGKLNLNTPRQPIQPSPGQKKTTKFAAAKKKPKMMSINTTADSYQLSSLINSNKMKSLNTTRNEDILQKYKLLQNSSDAGHYENRGIAQASTLQQTDSSNMPINSIAQLNQLNKMQSLQDDFGTYTATTTIMAPTSARFVDSNQRKSNRQLATANAVLGSPMKARIHTFGQATHVLRTIRDASNDNSGASSPRFNRGGQYDGKIPATQTAESTPGAWSAEQRAIN